MNLNKILNHKHQELFQSTADTLSVRGGANAGKTYSIADKLFLQPIIQPNRRLKAMVVRKTMPSLKNSVLDVLERRAEAFGLPFKTNMNMNKAQCLNLEILFISLNNKDDYIKAKSITDVDFVWVNEMTELREYDFDILDMRIRGGESRFKQFIFDFNPVGKTSWIFKRFYENNNNGNGAHKLLYTVLDNPWAKKEEIAKLKGYKESDENLYKIYFLGEWGELEGVIYDWDIVPLPDIKFDEIFYGGDFGYSVDPAALIKIYRKANEFWLEEVIYQTGLTNIKLGEKMKSKGIMGNDETYWDSAEPKSIQELYDLGINAKPAEKGPDSVRAGIDFLKQQKIHIVDGNEHIANEQKSYIWKKDKDGNSLNVPIDFNNHAMDATRYGIYTHCKGPIPIFEAF